MTTTSTTSLTATKRDKKSCGCRVDIRIQSKGDVNIYNCTAPEPSEPHPPAECPSGPIAPGQCVPLSIGSKPKQSQRHKLDRLLANTKTPSALAASFFHQSRRFLAGHAPANPFEQSTFALFNSLSPEVKGILSCASASFEAMSPAERDRLFDPTLPSDPNTPLDAGTLATAFAREITRRVGDDVFGNPNAVEQERPGLNRFFKPDGEIFDAQLRVCTLDGLRTVEFKPPLNPGDYLPSELQQKCVPIIVNGQPQLDCEVQTENCPGNFIVTPDNLRTCLRVPEVRNGDAVVLQGVNFISVDAKVRLTAKPPGTITRDVDAHVFGDLDTPLNEVVNGQTRLINDCRVHDRMTFVIPDDLPPGVYAVQIVMPNVSGIPILGDPILSFEQFVEIVPPPTARFQIASERLIARKETSPASFGSDEVRVRVRAYPITATATELVMGEEIAFDSPEFGDMDSGDVRDMAAVLFSHAAPIDGVVMTIMGFEIDSEKAYRDQINSFTDAFLHYLKIALAAVVAGGAAGAFAIGIKDLLKLALKHPIILAIAAAVVLVVILFLAAWAPADPIIADSLGFTAVDLARLTSADFPPPEEAHYPTQHDITVNVFPIEKAPTQYKERREYVSDPEDSRYEIILRYNRVA
jgi:hypothetical protein